MTDTHATDPGTADRPVDARRVDEQLGSDAPRSRSSRSAVDDTVAGLLDVARRRLGLEVAWVSSFVDGMQVFDIVASDDAGPAIRRHECSPLAESYCVRVLDGRLEPVVPDSRSHPCTRDLPVTSQARIGSYIGTPLRRTDGRVRGMVCCAGSSPADHLGEADRRSLELLADVIAHLLEEDDRRTEAAQDRRRALRDDITTGRIRTVFQPIFDLRSATVTGVEALTRIDGASVPIGTWFERAEAAGLATEAQLAAAVAAFGHLDRVPDDVYVAVNASPALIVDERLSTYIEASGAASRIIVEITEHRAIDDYVVFGRHIERLRRAGVRISVDDVGAGFSSFAHVLALQPDVVKIDRSIISGIDDDTARQAIATAIVSMAEQLGASVVAEGVETESELDTLSRLEVPCVQGFLLGRPEPLHDALTVDAAATRVLADLLGCNR